MKTDFSIHISVDLGVTPEIVALVASILNHKPIAMPAASQEQIEQQKQEERPAEQVQEHQPELPQAKVETEEKPKELTEQSIREIMHKTRQRIEGENYKDETDGENYKKFHRQLSATFKNIAALLGADKPSALPAEQRASFIEQCEQLEIMEDGTIGTKAVF